MILPYVSASQVDAYRRCKRVWFQRYILKVKEPTTPAMDRGKRIHGVIEGYLNTGNLPQPTEHGVYADVEATEIFLAAQDHLEPLVGSMVEHEIRMPTYDGGPDWVGFIDSVYTTENTIVVRDHKTLSDLSRYAKTEEELQTNTQLIAYATWALKQWPKYKWIDIGHIYLQTRKPYKSRLTSVTVTREHVEKIWQEELKVVREMVAVAASGVKDVNQIPPTLDACGMYGGCYFRPQCGLDVPAKRLFANIGGGLNMDTKPESGKTPVISVPIHRYGSFMKKMGTPLKSEEVQLTRVGELAEGVPVLEVPSDKPIICFTPVEAQDSADDIQSIVPPDAPDRNEVITIEHLEGEKKKRGRKPKILTSPEVVVEKKKRGRKPKAMQVPTVEPLQNQLVEKAFAKIDKEIENVADVLTKETPAIETVVVVPALPFKAAKKLVLYVDCVPTKGIHKNDNCLLEDFLAPIAERVAEELKVVDYRLKEYGEGKARIAAKVKEKLDSLPEVLVMTSQAPGFPEVYSILAPHATDIVRGIR